MRTLWLALMLLIGVSAASAHQLKTASTTILFNERTGNIEVLHRFFLHDAEHAVKQLFDKEADIHQLERTREQFSDYVQQRFSLATLDNQTLPLSHVGYEIDGNNFWVYQETPVVANLKGLKIRHKALQDVWQSQQNLVNVEGNGPLQSVTFKAADNWLDVYF
ncbi:DUF6702 family protein [Pseudidiomarina donghaiensis]|uniref:Orphan protein n=1 Tax=Pseudidiomarina donghaiensis TaxID=519452 RepID=A0A432XGL6_9GAMM|nr:DUF6702 family protein [Pseudidiomarina donghaiensis]RUO47898.1 hypothetical protein CWE24_07870 [Pseudidiomarina donghaiensis]SFV22569.1 hypothetical protein SAMN04488139_1393 [Pseudidiomarina donghaiensis]